MRIQHNISALNSWGKLGINQNAAAKNLEKLSSGYRINRAGDDAAGLAISEKMRGQIRGLDMASKNAQDGISLIQTAEGALDETHSILQRMRELAVQSANGTYQDEDRANTDLEIQALKSELDRIASSTHFNKIQLLDGSLSAGGANGTAGKGAAKVTVSDAALSNGVLDIVKAEKGEYTINDDGSNPLGAIQGEATNEYTISYKDTDGAKKNLTISMRFDSVAKKIVDANGNKLIDTANSTATSDETIRALQAALEKSGLGDKFKIETNASAKAATGKVDGLKFIAKDAGSAGAEIFTITQKSTGAVSKMLGQGAANSTTLTIDLSNVDMSKLKDGDTLKIGGKTITFTTTTANTTYDKTAGAAEIYINKFTTTESLADALKEIINADKGNLATLADGKANTIKNAAVGTGDDASKLVITMTSTFSAGDGSTNAVRNEVEAIMNGIEFKPKDGDAIKGGVIGASNAGVSYIAKETKAATDRYETYDLAKVKGWNPGDEDDDIADHIFEVNGEKFLFVKQNANNQAITDDAIAKATAIYGNSLNVVTLHTTNADPDDDKGTNGVAISELDVINMAERIKEKTGTNVRVNGTKLEFLATPGTAGGANDGKLVFQIGANGDADQRVSMSIDDMSSKGIGVDAVNILTADSANAAIDIVDKAINTVSATRANLGAMQNRLEHTINSLNTTSENLTAAESRIRDVDMAKEMMSFTKNNILTQAAQAMLAQANQQPQGVLQLLQ